MKTICDSITLPNKGLYCMKTICDSITWPNKGLYCMKTICDSITWPNKGLYCMKTICDSIAWPNKGLYCMKTICDSITWPNKGLYCMKTICDSITWPIKRWYCFYLSTINIGKLPSVTIILVEFRFWSIIYIKIRCRIIWNFYKLKFNVQFQNCPKKTENQQRIYSYTVLRKVLW